MMSEIFLGGGCFWCVEARFAMMPKVSCIPGYMGGHIENPTYEQVCSGLSGHYEVCRISGFRNLDEVLNNFWKIIDPFDPNGQFADQGSQYKTVIFYTNNHQKDLIIESISNIEKQFDKVVATIVLPAMTFYPAEEYHQQYYLKNPEHYRDYVHFSNRKYLLECIWNSK
ncbi:MAG: peptide-methionine (S)-S-oxide reductase [Legionellales bacterium]|nr:peptide-methionine (S)-S-oxide reductase [Legionellales bacterium]OUX68286.1 MAG: peptide-methionine (S)-S-oxide reductase [bacterium TMED178]|tara:strand:+ start:7117 stop:7623 length:507 start_codon:yes stop_codon:yes gene_type:complete